MQSSESSAVSSEHRAGTIENLRKMVDRVRPVSSAEERLIPIHDELEQLFDGGFRRGTTVVVDGSAGSTSLTMALCGQATTSGLWLGCLNMASLGWAAANELGVDLKRVATVDVEEKDFSSAAAVMVDVFDLVLCSRTQVLTSAQTQRLVARARERGCCLLFLGDRAEARLSGHGRPASQRVNPFRQDGPDALFMVEDARWDGLGNGTGRLRSWHLEVTVQGRRRLSRPRSVRIDLPDITSSWMTRSHDGSFSDGSLSDLRPTPLRSGSGSEATTNLAEAG